MSERENRFYGMSGGPSTHEGRSLLEAVAEVAELAANVALRHFRSGLIVERKSDGSPGDPL